MVSPMATSVMPNAAPASSGRSATATLGKAGMGKPWGKTPTTSTPLAARSKIIDTAMATTTAMRMPGTRGATRFSPRMIEQREQPHAQRPEIGLIEIGHEIPEVGDHIAAFDRIAEELGQLADEDRDGQTGQIADAHRLREQIGHKAELGDAGAHRDQRRPSAPACRPARWRSPCRRRPGARSRPRSWGQATNRGRAPGRARDRRRRRRPGRRPWCRVR